MKIGSIVVGAIVTIVVTGCSSIGSNFSPGKCCGCQHAHYHCGCGASASHVHSKAAAQCHGMMCDQSGSGDIDADFAHRLHRHNEMEIAMSKRYLERGKAPDLQKLARESAEVSERQNRELDRLSRSSTR